MSMVVTAWTVAWKASGAGSLVLFSSSGRGSCLFPFECFALPQWGRLSSHGPGLFSL